MYSAIMIKAASVSLAAVIVADQRVMTDIVQGLIYNVEKFGNHCNMLRMACAACCASVACAHAFPRKREFCVD